MPFWTSWSFWLYLLCWLPYTASLLIYGIRSPWRHGSVGRGLMTLFVALVAILTLVLVAQTGLLPPEFRDVFRAVALSGVAAAGFYQLKNIVQLQHEAGRGKGNRDPALADRGPR